MNEKNSSPINEVIIKRGNKYFLYSKNRKRKLGGPYRSKKDALKREREVQFFKHLKEDYMMPLTEKFLDYYVIFGWISPEGEVFVPDKDKKTHSIYYTHDSLIFELTGIKNSNSGLKKGWIRWFIEKQQPDTIVLEFLSEFKNYRAIIKGCEKIQDMVISGELQEVSTPELTLPTQIDLYPLVLKYNMIFSTPKRPPKIKINNHSQIKNFFENQE